MSWRNYHINNSFCLLCLSSLMTPLSTFCTWTLLNLPTENQWPWSLRRLRGSCPPTCCHARPFHSPSTRSPDRRCTCMENHTAAWHTWWDLQCKTVCYLISSCKWGTPLGDLMLPLHPTFSMLSSSLHLKERQANRCAWHGNGEAALQVTEKQTHWGIGMTGIKCLMEEIW